jgi:hypothetical protein
VTRRLSGTSIQCGREGCFRYVYVGDEYSAVGKTFVCPGCSARQRLIRDEHFDPETGDEETFLDFIGEEDDD